MKNGPTLLVTIRSDPGITLDAYARVLAASGFTNIIKCALQKSANTADADLMFFLEEYEPSTRCKKFPWEREGISLMATR
jgi:hypothetical protein